MPMKTTSSIDYAKEGPLTVLSPMTNYNDSLILSNESLNEEIND
jgi:hypothetical protein